ncbi:hypothetical protein BASA81_011043 [Batrachochytrium salamandrivorans]|nr:hypothetical protein BASA81_011043 [Batrachochytrium salamandrivorans]
MEPLTWQTEPLRARPKPPPSTRQHLSPSHAPAPAKETLCTMVCTELDPRSIARWPRYFAGAVVRSCQVVATFRQIRFNDVVGGIVNSCLLFTFAAVFSSAIFGDVGLSQYVALGTACNLVTTVIIQAAFSFFSDAGINICGPDINPTIFLATMSGVARQAMITSLMEQQQQPGQEGGDGMSGSPTNAPTAFDAEKALNPERLLSTVLAVIIISSVTFGTFVYLLGRLKVSRGIRLIPGSILAGFLASIGYLVVVKAIKTSMPHDTYDAGPGDAMWWAFAAPGLPIGVLMYLQKRWHVGNPVVLIPIILVVPLSLFFIIVYGSGSDIEQVREQGWLFPAFGSELFYSQLIDSYGRYDYVDWNAVTATVPTMIVMIFIVTVDALLKQASIRKMLKAHDMRIDHELMLMGKTNILIGLFAGPVGYPQPKLTYINYGLVQNTTSRVSGMIVCLFNAVLFFSGFPLVNYLPRFWLAGVLFFAAAGFVVENLWDSRLRFSRKEYFSIWVIVVINALFGMAWAVIVGIVLSALIFAMAYSRGGSIKAVISGSQYRSSVVRTKLEDAKLDHLGSRAVIVQLHRYVFFGSAAYVSEFVIGLIKEQESSTAEEKRAVYFVFDWANVEDVDVTALGVLQELMSIVVTEQRTVLFTGLDSRLRQKLADEGVVQAIHPAELRNAAAKSQTSREDELNHITGSNRRCFETLDRGMEFVEQQLLQRADKVRKHWFECASLHDYSLRAQYLEHCHSYEQVLVEMLGDEASTFLERVLVPRGWSLFRAGEVDVNVYLVKEGSLSVMMEDAQQTGSVSRFQSLKPGSFVNEGALCSSSSSAAPKTHHTVVADVDSEVYSLSPENRHRLESRYPAIAIEIHRLALGHSNRTKQKIVDVLGSLKLWDHELAPNAVGRGGENDEVDLALDDTTSIARDLESGSDHPFASQQADQANNNAGVAGSRSGAMLDAMSTKTIEAVKGVVLLPAEVLKSGLILSGLRSEDQGEFMDDATRDLLSTNQIRDGAGEEEGRRLAQLFTEMRRANLSLSLAPSANQHVKDFRGWKNIDTLDDVEECVGAIYQTALEQQGGNGGSDVVQYRLLPSTLAHAQSAFSKQLVLSVEPHTHYGTSIPTVLPRARLPAALAQVGILFSKEEEQELEPVTLDEFLQLCVRLTTPALGPDVVSGLYAFHHHVANGLGLTKDTLQRALPHVPPPSIANFCQLWGGQVDFDALCSAVSQYTRNLDLDKRVEAEWSQLSGGTGLIRAHDVERVFGVSTSTALEMIWEADTAHKDGLLLFDLLEALTLRTQ